MAWSVRSMGWMLLIAVVGCDGATTSREQTSAGVQTATLVAGRPDIRKDPGAPGPFAVGFTFATFVDASRTGNQGEARAIPVHLWYPVDPEDVRASTPEAVYPLDPNYAPGHSATSSEVEAFGIDRAYQDPSPSRKAPFPVVLLSPGYSQDGSFYAFHGARLASHGIVVAALSHPGDGDFNIAFPVHPAKAQHDRPRDLSFVLDRLLAASAAPGRWHRLVDPDEVAAAGHSVGGYAAMVTAGGDDDACDAIGFLGPPPPEFCVASPPDPRFRAVLRLDASEWLLQFHEMARIRVPTITMNQPSDAYAGDCAGLHVRGHAAASSRVNLRIDVLHSNHQSFTAMCAWLGLYQAKGIIDQSVVDQWTSWFCSDPAAIDWREANRLASKYMIAFLKTHLAHEPSMAPILTSRWVWYAEPQVGLFTTERGGESHFGPGSPCLEPGWLDEFDYYWYMPPPPGARERPALD